MKKIVLASKSPRRKELLEKCNISFITDPADIDETINDSLSFEEAIQELSFRKAEAVLRRNEEAIVIGSDTIVTIDGEILGKPENHADAKRMLSLLQGRTHRVITGLCILSKNRCYQDVSVSEVTFAQMDEKEIETYIATGECDDKAGAYGIQGLGGRYVTEIKGDYYAIMGLPLNKVYEELKNVSLY